VEDPGWEGEKKGSTGGWGQPDGRVLGLLDRCGGVMRENIVHSWEKELKETHWTGPSISSEN